MESRFYYRVVTDPENNFNDPISYITVNCTGHSFFGGEVRANSVRRDYYLIYLCSGAIRVQQPKIEKLLEPGDLIVFEAGKNFEYLNNGDIEYYWVHFTGYGAIELMSQCGIQTNTPYSPGMHERMSTDFRELFDVFLNRNAFFAVESANRLTKTLIDLGKYISRLQKPFKSHSAIQQSITYILNHISEPLSVNQLASKGHMSVSRFRTLFHEVADVSPQIYIIRSKLNYACERMRHGDETIKQISLSVGFSDPLYFSRLFKKHIGLSPGDYRKQYK